MCTFNDVLCVCVLADTVRKTHANSHAVCPRCRLTFAETDRRSPPQKPPPNPNPEQTNCTSRSSSGTRIPAHTLARKNCVRARTKRAVGATMRSFSAINTRQCVPAPRNAEPCARRRPPARHSPLAPFVAHFLFNMYFHAADIFVSPMCARPCMCL